MPQHPLKALTVLILAASSLPACSRASTATVVNHSKVVLSHFVLAGPSFSAPVPDLSPGGTAFVRLSPRGEAGHLDVSFQAGSRVVRHRADTYYERNGYSIRIIIQQDLQVAVTTTIASWLRPPVITRAVPATQEERPAT